jgi:glycosyltransferase involved in cell wall biosynthesis
LAERTDTGRPEGILMVSNMYPSAADTVFGSFVARQQAAFEGLGVRVRLVANQDARPGGAAAAVKYPSLLVRALWAARKRDFSVVVAHFIYPTAIIASMAARLSGKPLVLVVHGTDIKSARGSGYLARKTREAVARACLVIAVSEDLARQVRELGTKVPVAVCHMGVDTRRFKPTPGTRPELGLDPDERIAIYVGNLIPRKNVALLVDAFALLQKEPGLCDRVVVIGNGPLEADVHAQVTALGLDDKVTFVDQMPQEQLPAWLSAADLFVLPSKYEGLGLVLLEAMACGTPAAGPRVGGVPEVVDDSVGAIYDTNDPVALADAMRGILTAGKASYSDACVKHAADNDLFAMADRFLSQIVEAGCVR